MHQTAAERCQIESCYQNSVKKTWNVQLFLSAFGPLAVDTISDKT